MNLYFSVLLLCGVLLAASGCQKTTHLTTVAAGHQINADITGNHSVETQSNQCVISSAYGKITIERSRVQFDSESWTSIPEDVSVKARITRGKLWVNAGPVTASRTIN